MNYSDSKKILEEVKGSQKILLNCHTRPDPDSLGSTLALLEVLEKMGKEVRVVCPNEGQKDLDFLYGFERVEKTDFDQFDFSNFDLFISLDTADWKRVVGDFEVKKPDNFKIIVIDHHKTNEGFGFINIIDPKVTSTAEILYKIFEDWDTSINKSVATSLMAGIIGDTGAFKFPGLGPETFFIAGKLMEVGADKEKIIHRIYFSTPLPIFKYWAYAFGSLKIDKKKKFAWIAIPSTAIEEKDRDLDIKETIASTFMQSIKGTDFGIVMVEHEPKNLGISFRARNKVDVSVFAQKLGGGGHAAAAGARLRGLEFKKAVEKVLEIVREDA